MMYYGNNALSCFATHLWYEDRLSGNWSVALIEIYVPCTATHIQEPLAFYAIKLKEQDIPKTIFADGI